VRLSAFSVLSPESHLVLGRPGRRASKIPSARLDAGLIENPIREKVSISEADGIGQ
jgi:hypothetical protein